MSPIVLLRHASAGSRRDWAGDDRRRPLDAKGLRQAVALATSLGERPIDRVLTSPYLRCVQTVEPLAAALALEIEICDELAEGASAHAVRQLLASAAEHEPVVCTHGDVIADLVGWGQEARKASAWILRGPRFEPDSYLPPPKL